MNLALEVPEKIISLDTSLLTIIVGVLLPIIVALVTKRVTKTSVQRILLVVLALIGGAITAAIAEGGTFEIRTTITNIAIAYFTGQTAYSSVLKPARITDKLLDVGGLTISADPDKVAAEKGEATTADAAGAVIPDAVVAPVAANVEVGDLVPVDDGEPEDETPDGGDVVPYDEDPDDEVPVINPDDVRVTEGP
jgi:hypothetical protein